LGELYAQNGQLPDAIQQFREVTRRQPKASRVWLRLAQVAELQGEQTLALEAYRTVDALAPDDPRVRIRIAWLLATANDAQVRDGATAVRLAEAIRKVSRGDPIVLDVLAAAYAEVGRYEDAARIANQAATLLDKEGDDPILRQIRAREKIYKQNKAYRSTYRSK
jgi:cytochrome c-type biogenesis protein CcmH/NrfG